ncbi:MAG: histidine phosphatase family protein [Planctomycetota bacterium]
MTDSPTRLLLVRHGATEANEMRPYILQGCSVDLPLSGLGRRQAAAVAEFLADETVDAVYCSPMVRAAATAGEIANRHSLKPAVRPGLREVDVGRWERMTWDAIAAEYPAEHAAFRAHPGHTPYLGGESYADVAARVFPELLDICAAHPGRTVVAVAHNVVNRAFLASLLGLEMSRARELVQTNACVNVIEYDAAAGRATVQSMNVDAHLGDARLPR